MRPAPENARECRICGCTDRRACFGGCHWIGPDLCSQCGEGGPAASRGHGPDDEGGEDAEGLPVLGPDDECVGWLS